MENATNFRTEKWIYFLTFHNNDAKIITRAKYNFTI